MEKYMLNNNKWWNMVEHGVEHGGTWVEHGRNMVYNYTSIYINSIYNYY